MVSIADNFLNDVEYVFLKNYILNNLDMACLNEFNNWYHNHSFSTGRIEDVRTRLGIQWFQIVSKIKKYLEQLLNFDLLVYSVKVSVTNEKNLILAHLDDHVHNRALCDSFTCIIYLNDSWDQNMGGLWSDGDLNVEPVRNRLLVYSRDIKHLVTAANAPWPYNRLILLTSWAKS